MSGDSPRGPETLAFEEVLIRVLDEWSPIRTEKPSGFPVGRERTRAGLRITCLISRTQPGTKCRNAG